MDEKEGDDLGANTVNLCGHLVVWTLINAQVTCKMHNIRIMLAAFVAKNPHIPLQRNVKRFAATFLRLSPMAREQRAYMVDDVDPYNVTSEDSVRLQQMNSNVTVLLFQGKVMITGARNRGSAILTANCLAQMLNEQTDLCTAVQDCVVSNQMVGFAIPFCVNLESLAACPLLGSRVKYDPEKFPMASIRCMRGEIPEPVPGYEIVEGEEFAVPTSNRAALVSWDGPLIITGARSVEEAKRYARHIMPHLINHMDSKRSDCLNHGKKPPKRPRGERDPLALALTLANIVGNTVYDGGSRYSDPSDTLRLGPADAPDRTIQLARQREAGDESDHNMGLMMVNLSQTLENLWPVEEKEDQKAIVKFCAPVEAYDDGPPPLKMHKPIKRESLLQYVFVCSQILHIGDATALRFEATSSTTHTRSTGTGGKLGGSLLLPSSGASTGCGSA